MEIKYHLDDRVDPAIAEGLRRRGVNVSTTLEAGLAGISDEDQLAYATAGGRVVVARNRHFLALHARGIPHAGIAYWHPKRRHLGQVVLDLVLLWRVASAKEMSGRVEHL